MTAPQSAPDCEPTWPDPADSDQPPDPYALRQTEIRDLRGQGPGPVALWTAVTIHAEEYL
jgi:hypothetical protein